MPDIDQRFWQQYQDRGLTVVALNPHDDLERIDEVRAFCEKLAVSYPVGLEETDTYRLVAQNFAGLNPFPVDLIIGKDGRVAYITREYDPVAMAAVIERLLDE